MTPPITDKDYAAEAQFERGRSALEKCADELRHAIEDMPVGFEQADALQYALEAVTDQLAQLPKYPSVAKQALTQEIEAADAQADQKSIDTELHNRMGRTL